MAEVLEKKLKQEGYEIAVAHDGQEGFEKIKSFVPGLILLDIVMPKMDGYEVLEKLREEKISIPAIIISNSGQPVEIDRTKKLGAVDHLIKTQFDPAEVIEKVNNYISQMSKEIPREAPTEKPKKVSNETVDAKAKTTTPDNALASILLVEDDPFLRNICARKLVKENFEVREAMDGEQALRMIQKAIPDIILLDLILPSIDGFEVLTKIRADKNKALAETPVIILSNLGQDEEIQRGLSLGANSFMVKANSTTGEIVEKVKKTIL